MNILFIVPYAPTLIRVRPYNLIKFLTRLGHHITLATLYESIDELRALEAWRSTGVNVIAAPLTRARSIFNAIKTLPSRDPLQAAYCDSPELMRLIQEQINAQHFDVVHIEHLRGAGYALKLETLNLKLPIIWDSVDCITYLFEQAARYRSGLISRLITRLELGRTRQYEARLAAQFDRVLVTSEVDRGALQSLAPRASIEVLPNGVDLDYFSLRPDSREADTLIFSGKMSYHANSAAAHYLINEIMPLVWQQRSNVKLIIAGNRPPRSIRAAANDRIEVTGSLPDIRSALWRASIAVAPLVYGAGIQNKILEALACGLPVIASPRALAAVPRAIDRGAVLADEPQSFADSIVKLLADQAWRDRLSASGREYVMEQHDWRNVAQTLVGIYQNSKSM